MAAGQACLPRGKSGLLEATVPGNARPGQPEGQRHREQSAPHVGVMVKRCGKSAPRDGQPDRHGKPHREQCQIGVSRIGQLVQAASAQTPGLAARGRLVTHA